MHPARLRIHPGGGSRAPGSRPSRQPAPRLSGRPGGDTGGRAPRLPRSFHCESTWRKLAKLVSRWLLRASREVPRINLRRRRFQVAPARPRLGGVGSEAGAERGAGCAPGAAWRAPRRSDPGGRLLPGRCARPRPLCPRSPRPGPAPPRSRPSGVLFGPGGSRPGGARRGDRYGDAGAHGGGVGPGPLPCGSPPPPRGAGPRGPGRERRGRAPGRPLPVGRWLCVSGPARPEAPASHPGDGSAESAVPAAARAGPGRREAVRGAGRPPAFLAEKAAGGGRTSPAKGRRLQRAPRTPPHGAPRDFATRPATHCIQRPLGWTHFLNEKQNRRVDARRLRRGQRRRAHVRPARAKGRVFANGAPSGPRDAGSFPMDHDRPQATGAGEGGGVGWERPRGT